MARTLVVLATTAGVVLGGAALLGGPVSAAVTGLVVAAVTSLGANDATFAARAVTTVWTAVAASAAAVLAAVLGGPGTPLGVTGFVAVGVVVVFLQRLGPRGSAPGLGGFIAYLATSLTGLDPGGLPLAVGGALVAAGVVVAVRRLVRPRRPGRVARRVLGALETRAALVLFALAALVRDGDERATRRVRRRLGGLRHAAGVADTSLEEAADADAAVVAGVDHGALGVRVFDLRLELEHLADLLDLDAPDGPAAPCPDLAALLDEVGRALLDRPDAPRRWTRVDAHLAASGPDDEQRVRRTLDRLVRSWRRAPDEGRDGGSEAVPADGPGGPTSPPLADTARRAVQVALAIALAALVGPWISSSQWFFAVVVAFVVFVSSSSRGDVLSEGAQRTVGTLIGAAAGVGLAFWLQEDPVVSVVLVAVCLAGALYAMGLSSTALMFFITVAIALVYGLLGRFTVDVLLVRLAETALGAGIGIAVSFLVLPTRTRTTFADATVRFLRAVRAVLDASVEVLAAEPVRRAGGGVAVAVGQDEVRELRDAYAGVEAAAGPLTDGLAGALDRTGHRRRLQAAASCDHHARFLVRLADRHAGGLGDGDGDGDGDGGAADALRGAADHVLERVADVARRLDRAAGDPDDPDDPGSTDGGHGRRFGALDGVVARLDDGAVLEAAGARLRAVDRALGDVAGRG